MRPTDSSGVFLSSRWKQVRLRLRLQHSSSNHHTTSSTQARNSTYRFKNMLHTSGLIIFRVIAPKQSSPCLLWNETCNDAHFRCGVQQVQQTALRLHMEYAPEFHGTHAPSHFTEQTIPLRSAGSLLYSSVCGSIRYRRGSTGLRSARAQMMHDLR